MAGPALEKLKSAGISMDDLSGMTDDVKAKLDQAGISMDDLSQIANAAKAKLDGMGISLDDLRGKGSEVAADARATAEQGMARAEDMVGDLASQTRTAADQAAGSAGQATSQ
jgi:hypothetical protein